jgi:predicted nucleic acid-binding protein
MTGEPPRRGLLDTNIMILRARIAPDELPDEMAISAVTLAELSAGPHEVRPDTEQDAYFEAAERARRLDVLQRAEHEFDPIPFDPDAARAYGRVTAAVVAAGRKPRRRAADLMIASTAIAAELPLYTTNPGDFVGLDHLVTVIPVTVIPVTRPEVPNERQPAQ